MNAVPIYWTDPLREQQFNEWLAPLVTQFDLSVATLHLASADASFRRYFRILSTQNKSFVVMDAPPDKEDSTPFCKVAVLMKQAGLRAPEVLDWHEAKGFLLLTDLGQKTMLESLDPASVAKPEVNLPYFISAIELLVKWQQASKPDVLAPYDKALLHREISLFDQWYVTQHKGHTLTPKQSAMLTTTYDQIIANNLSSPSVFVHRDFMPRNLMVPDTYSLTDGAMGLTGPDLGVLDFQDAVYGPITYDIASLMRDAFWSWEEDFVLEVTIRYWERARKAQLPVASDFGDFYRAVDWMALQRHLKIAGIFARLTLRDGKPKYLADTPRFIQYIRQTAGRYRELTPLLRLIDEIEGLQALSGFAYGRM
jgi:aminoglycoside/choline kinase family phosphotransferase